MEEGDKARMYKCPAGHWTIGAGINLEVQEMPEHIRRLWLTHILNDVEKKLNDDPAIPFPILKQDFIIHNADLVMLDMAYQMGVNGLKGFKNMLRAIHDLDWEKAADELLDSNYARQTPNRAKRNAELLRGCE